MADQPSREEISPTDRPEIEEIGAAESPENGAESPENDVETDTENTESGTDTEAQQGQGSRDQATNQPGTQDPQALAERLTKIEAELASSKSKPPTRARVRIDTQTVPPVRKNEKPPESPAPTRREQRRRYLFGKR